MIGFEPGPHWTSAGKVIYRTFARGSGPHFAAAVQVEYAGQQGPLLYLFGQGYPSREEAIAAAREVLVHSCGMPPELVQGGQGNSPP